MQYIFYILLFPFLFINYKIIISDLKEKKIPNLYLGYLLLLIPFFYIFIFYIQINLNIYIFSFQIVLTFFISFLLYYFGIWAAGDAKYLLTLTLFIPYIGIIPFIGNLALITISYLLLYFIWFYLLKVPLNKGYAKSLLTNIKNDLLEKWIIYKNNKGGKNIFIILKWLVLFLTIFVSFRLARLYFLNLFISTNNSYFDTIKNLVGKYDFYIFFLLILTFIGTTILVKKIYVKISNVLVKKYNFNKYITETFFIITLFFSLTLFITYEYSINPKEISNSLYKILTVYISLHIIIKILIYSYKVTFGLAESDYINIDNLKVGDIVDKNYLLKLFGNQDSLLDEKIGLFGGNPIEYFKNFKNPVDLEELEIIKKSFTIVNDFHKKQNANFNQEINQIKILKTFAFGPYICIGFLITVIFGNKLFIIILNSVVDIIKGIVG